MWAAIKCAYVHTTTRVTTSVGTVPTQLSVARDGEGDHVNSRAQMDYMGSDVRICVHVVRTHGVTTSLENVLVRSDGRASRATNHAARGIGVPIVNRLECLSLA